MAVELLRVAWEAGRKPLSCWASWLRQQQLLGVAMPSLKSCGKRPIRRTDLHIPAFRGSKGACAVIT